MKNQLPSGQIKILVGLLITVVFASCSSKLDLQSSPSGKTVENTISPELSNAIPDSVVNFLIYATSKDFQNSNLRMPINFQDVKIGYISTPNNEKYYILSGQFLSKEKNKPNEWVPFATIKTSDVEHWKGAVAMSFYNNSQVIVDKGEHISSSLKRKIWTLQLSE